MPKAPLISRIIPNNQETPEGLTIPDFKLYYRAIVIKKTVPSTNGAAFHDLFDMPMVVTLSERPLNAISNRKSLVAISWMLHKWVSIHCGGKNRVLLSHFIITQVNGKCHLRLFPARLLLCAHLLDFYRYFLDQILQSVVHNSSHVYHCKSFNGRFYFENLTLQQCIVRWQCHVLEVIMRGEAQEVSKSTWERWTLRDAASVARREIPSSQAAGAASPVWLNTFEEWAYSKPVS